MNKFSIVLLGAAALTTGACNKSENKIAADNVAAGNISEAQANKAVNAM